MLHTPRTITIDTGLLYYFEFLNEFPCILLRGFVNGNMNIPISAGEVTIDPTTLLFDENLIMNKEITELITNTLLLRDTKEQPLQEHELNLLKVLAVDDDTNTTINEHVTTILEPCLKRKVDGEKLARHELRLFGQLAYKGFKSTDDGKLLLPNFTRSSPFQVARVPETRISKSTEKSTHDRNQRNRLGVANNWMSHLSGNFTESLVVSFIKDNPSKVKHIISKHHPQLYRLSPEQTSCLQVYMQRIERKTGLALLKIKLTVQLMNLW